VFKRLLYLTIIFVLAFPSLSDQNLVPDPSFKEIPSNDFSYNSASWMKGVKTDSPDHFEIEMLAAPN
jgi:hypothetical protein